MNGITVGELRKLLAGLPEEAVIETGTEGDYDTWTTVTITHPDGRDEVITLDAFEPGETYHGYKARKEKEQEPKRDFAKFLDSLLLDKPYTPPRNAVTCSHCLRVFVFGKADESDGSRCPLCPVPDPSA